MSNKENNPNIPTNNNPEGNIISLEKYRQENIGAFGMTRKQIQKIRDDVEQWDREQDVCEEDLE